MHSTAEEIAQFLWHQILERLGGAEYLHGERGVEEMVVFVAERVTQRASFRGKVTPVLASTETEQVVVMDHATSYTCPACTTETVVPCSTTGSEPNIVGETGTEVTRPPPPGRADDARTQLPIASARDFSQPDLADLNSVLLNKLRENGVDAPNRSSLPTTPPATGSSSGGLPRSSFTTGPLDLPGSSSTAAHSSEDNLFPMTSPTQSMESRLETLIQNLLKVLGVDVTREGLRKTPLRSAKAWLELTEGYRISLRDVVNDAIFDLDERDELLDEEVLLCEEVEQFPGGGDHVPRLRRTTSSGVPISRTASSSSGVPMSPQHTTRRTSLKNPSSPAAQVLLAAPQEQSLVFLQDIPFSSLCEHHLLPFTGFIHIGILPNKTVLGLSKIPRICEMYARRLQLQERMTRQIGEAIMAAFELERRNSPKITATSSTGEGEYICSTDTSVHDRGRRTEDHQSHNKCRGVAVLVTDCVHHCMCSRGAKMVGVKTTTSFFGGEFRENGGKRAEFMALVGRRS